MQGVQVGNIYYTVSMDTAQMIRDSQKAGQNLGTLNVKLTATAQAAKEATRQVDGSSQALSRLTKVMAAYVSLRTLQYLAGLSDAYQQNASRIRNATKSTEEYDRVQARLLATANGTYRSLGEAQEVFLATSRTLQQLGYTTEEVLDISDSLSYAFTRDAARADQASSAMDAYSKSLAKGKVDADAWGTIIAASDSIIDNVAKATGKTALEIQKLGAEGKLSLEALNEGLRRSLGENKAAAEGMAVSTKDATVQMRNALTVFVGKVDEASGASSIFTEKAGELAELLQDPQTINAAVDMANGIVTALNTIIKGMRTTVEIAKWFGEELAARFHGAASDDIVRLEQQVERWDEIARNPLERFRFGATKNGEREWFSYYSADEAKAEKEKAKKQLEEAIALRDKLGKPKPSTDAPKGEIETAGYVSATGNNGKPTKPTRNSEAAKTQREADQLAQKAADYLKNLQQQADVVGKMTNLERVNYDIKNAAVQLSDEQIKIARDLAAQVDARAEAEKEAEAALNIQNAALSAQRQLMGEIAGYNADIAGASMGDRARSEMEQRIQIEQQFAQRVQQIEDQRRQTMAQADEKDRERISKMYDDVLRIEQDYQGRSLAAYDEYIQRKREADADWSNGAQRAWANYVEESQNAASQAESAMSSWLSNTEDALAKFVQTGKLSFSDLANSIIADLARIAAKQLITGLLGNIFGSFMGGWSAAGVQSSGAVTAPVTGGGSGWQTTSLPPQREHGGPVTANQMYEVNEKGKPELLSYGGKQYLMMGNQSGNVTPMGGAAGGGVGSLKVIIENKGQAMEATGARMETNGMEQVLRVFVQQEIRKEAQNLAGGRGVIDQGLKSRYVMTPRR